MQLGQNYITLFLMKKSTDVYLILGTTQSGRREILWNLIEGVSGSGDGGKDIILIASDEIGNSAQERLQGLENTEVLEWSFSGERANIPGFEASVGDRIFIVLSAKTDLIDQIEGLKYWLDSHPEFSLARVLSMIDCQVAYEKEDLLPWFEAVVYFSDHVFLTHRENVPEKWVSDFIKSFEKRCYPCTFEKIRNNKVSNPSRVLEPGARRISHIFDDLDAIDTLDLDEENLPEEPFELTKKVDLYLQRDDEGRRVIKLPSILD